MLNQKIAIFSACHKDIPTIVEMWQSIDRFPNHQRPFGGDSDDKAEQAQTLIEHAINSDSAVVFIALDTEDNIIGTISGHVFEKPAVNIQQVGVIYSLWVNEEYRQQGVGQALLNELETSLKAKGAKAFQVGWDCANTLAKAWWEKRGYCAYEMIASKTE